MEILSIGPAEQEIITRMLIYAHANPLSMDDLLDTINNPSNAPGLKPEHQCQINDFKIVYSIDCLPEGKIRHLSISRDKKDVVPSIEATKMIMKACGFVNDLQDCKIKFEKLEPGYTAVNIGELI